MLFPLDLAAAALYMHKLSRKNTAGSSCTNCHAKNSAEGRDGHGVPVQRAAAVHDAEGSQQEAAGDLLLVAGVDGAVGRGGVTQVQRVAHGGVVQGEACSSSVTAA